MIAAQSLGIQFGGEYLFSDVSFIVNPGDRIGLVGANGAGKTTLMRTLIGRQQPDEGRVATNRHAVVGYLPQEGVVLSDKSVRDEVMTAFSEAIELEQEIEKTIAEISRRANDPNSEDYQELLEDLGEMQHRFEAMNGFSMGGEVEKILMGLGFLPEDFERSCQTFSGGWQMRIELAKLLLRQPDLLMLDEPTNHLDIESLTWLEAFLQRYQGGILLISHDRRFLDNLCNKIFEMSLKRLTVYTGNYSSYLVQREERVIHAQAAYENQQKMIAETEKFIERFRYKATKATQVQSRVKALERLERHEAPEVDSSSVKFRFPPAPRSGRVVIEMKNVVKRYDDNLVLNGVDFALERGEKVAFLGRNGEGKSTFSRLIAGIEGFQSGERIPGHNTEIGYFAQHQAEDLNPRNTVLETLDAVATGDIRLRLRTLLGAFLFHGDDVFKRVGVLSGGEKSRVALAKLLLEPANLLIFDEPTNHLDMRSKDVLKQALIDFDGALIIVSHDRDFLDGIVGKCIEFRKGKIREYLGGVEDYLRQHQTGSIDDAFAPTRNTSSSKTASKSSPAASSATTTRPDAETDGLSQKERKRLEAERRNKRYAATKQLRNEIAKVEKDIATYEERKSNLEVTMALPETYGDGDKTRKTQQGLADAEKRLAELYSKWERLSSEIEKVEAGLE
jgi:ATP-binding cassette, subfamily F, member 3